MVTVVSFYFDSNPSKSNKTAGRNAANARSITTGGVHLPSHGFTIREVGAIAPRLILGSSSETEAVTHLDFPGL